MSSQMTPHTYACLVEGNKLWLLANTDDCLERQHIIAMMADMVKQYASKNICDTLKNDIFRG